jgi:hypothetical protein
VAEAVGPATAPVARLERALAHGTTPTIVEIWTFSGFSPVARYPLATPTEPMPAERKATF